MTKPYSKTDPVAWEQALKKFKAVQKEIRDVKDDDDLDEAVETCLRYGEAESALLAMVAPDIEGVIEKLWVFFGHEIRANTEESMQMCRVIGDLRRVQMVNDL